VPLTLVAVMKRDNMVDLTYGETDHDPRTIILTVTPQRVAAETSKSLPLGSRDVQAYILMNVTKLQAVAENCKAQGFRTEMLR
jgi:hypothetical protein